MVAVFGRIGLLSFGGPAAQIALMHRELVDRHRWLDEQTFLRALSLCMLLPGPEAMQLATYAGWRMRGTMGGIVAGALFVLPGAAVIGVLALLYLQYGQLPLVQAAFLGVKAAVVIVVFQALSKVAGKALVGTEGPVIAALSFAVLFVLGLPFPLLILLAGVWGAFRAQVTHAVPAIKARQSLNPFKIVLWLTLWAAPLVLLWAMDAQFMLQVGVFFSKLAVVTFGGAYAVLGYMTQTVVTDLGWLDTQQMIDALGLAETTPGPLILVTQFVAMLAGHAQTGVSGALSAGLLALWVTFVPCFLWIFLAGPFLDQISANARVAGALRAITAAVVGVIANLSLWFAVHVAFASVGTLGGSAMPWPVWSSVNGPAIALCGLAGLLMLWRKLSFVMTLPIVALAGLLV
ncbi:chromate efflux transporter [Sulfitobacter sp. S190]|nr:chromate efflux transporter [Sulfitobacter sp. S190]UWR24156.1 chromate efflux transporter [Sulfitobacter sp. S190]